MGLIASIKSELTDHLMRQLGQLKRLFSYLFLCVFFGQLLTSFSFSNVLFQYDNVQDRYVQELEASFSETLDTELPQHRLVIPLFYESPDVMKTLLSHEFKTLGLSVLKRQPGLVLSGDEAVIRKAESFIKSIDVAAPLIRYKITIIELSFSKFDEYQSLFTQLADGFLINYDVAQQKFTPMPIIYGTLMDMLRTGSAKLVASPTLLAFSHTSGQIHIGDKVPYVSAFRQNGTVYEKVEFIDTGLKMDIIGHLTDADRVVASLDLEMNTIREWRQFESGSFPILSTRSTASSVEIPIGQTLMIAGFIQEGQTENTTSVPFFSRVPLIGRLFDGEAHSSEKTDILMLISPEVMR